MAGAVLAIAAALSIATSPRDLIDQLFQAFNRHDVSALQALYAPDARLMSSDFCKPRTGADVARTYRKIFRAFPGIRDDVISVVVDGDQASVRFVTSSGSPGNDFHFELMTFFRFSAGRIIEDDTVFDARGRPCESLPAARKQRAG
jgi:ketosteroid isomerase-like protein